MSERNLGVLTIGCVALILFMVSISTTARSYRNEARIQALTERLDRLQNVVIDHQKALEKTERILWREIMTPKEMER